MKYLLFLVVSLLIGGISMAQTLDSLTIKITSGNLSEDLTISSSKNDELLFLVYEFTDSIETLKSPIFISDFTFNQEKRSEELTILLQDSSISKYLFFLIELDSDITHHQIDPVLRVYFKEVMLCKDHMDYICTERYLGDEDIIGFGFLEKNNELKLTGSYKLDRYEYVISVN